MKHTVLVVDDVAENIDVMTKILNGFYQVKVAINGAGALKVAKKFLPDIILLDIMMPGMDGYEVCRQLKTMPETAKIPVIFVSARDQASDETRGFETGAVDYINKPVNPAVTLARVKTHIALSDQNKSLEIQLREQTREIRNTRLEIIRQLGKAVKYKDNDTGFHVESMSRYASIIGTAYGLSRHNSELLLQASTMHDIGKIGIPDEVLKKPGPLTDKEWELMVSHPEIGCKIIGDAKTELLQAAKIIAEQHHEKWDGTGYPNRLDKKNIHLYARLTAVADVFDALTTQRPYKKAWPFEKAVKFIQDQRGRHFDPAVVDAFSTVLPEIMEVKNQLSDTSGGDRNNP